MSTVLLPHEVKKLARFPDFVQVIHYRQKKMSVPQRIRKKFAPTQDGDSLAEKLVFEAGNQELATVEAMWMAPGISLSSDETEQLLDQLPELKWVYSQKAGADHLALDSYQHRNIRVSHSGNLVSAWVAQMNIACILSHAKNIPNHIHQQRHFKSRCLFSEDITRQTVGIVGTGNIGSETARMCSGLGMHVVGLSRNPDACEGKEHFDRIADMNTEFNRVLAEIDYLVLTLPLNSQTRGLIDAEKLELMKPTACIINLARPQIANEKELLDALIRSTVSSAYVSGLQNLSRLERIRAAWLPNLIQTHYSDAHVREKNLMASKQFLANLGKLQSQEEIENRIA